MTETKTDLIAENNKLIQEVESLKIANANLIQFTFGIINSLDETAKSLVKASNLLLVTSDRLRDIVNRSAAVSSSNNKQ